MPHGKLATRDQALAASSLQRGFQGLQIHLDQRCGICVLIAQRLLVVVVLDHDPPAVAVFLDDLDRTVEVGVPLPKQGSAQVLALSVLDVDLTDMLEQMFSLNCIFLRFFSVRSDVLSPRFVLRAHEGYG